MTITYNNDNDIIVYALEQIIAHARRTQQVFVAQCVWWLVSIIGLEQGLVNYIDNIQPRQEIIIIPGKATERKETISPTPRDTPGNERQDRVLKKCEEFLKDSPRLRDIAALKSKGKTQTGRINPTKISKISLQNKVKNASHDYSKTEGISDSEIQRWKESGECLRCAWPSARKGSHRVKDCIRPIKLDKGMASYPKAKENQRIKYQPPTVEEAGLENTSCEESSSNEL